MTAPLFEILGQQTRSMSGIESIYWGPRIEPAMQADWINYTLANQDWLRVSRSLEIEDKNSSWEEKEYDEIAITPVVFEIDSSGEVPQIALPKDQDGPWEPYWQMSPPITLSGLINYNLLAEDYIRVVEDAADTLKHGVFDQVRDFSGLSGLGMSVKEHDEFHASLVKSDRRQDVKDSFVSPHVNLVNPIFESVFDTKNSKIVGHLFSLITWDRYLVNLLPEGIGGIVIVLRNNCEQVFTYEIDGNFVSLNE